MESITILRELWHRRWLVLAVGVLALALGTLTAYRFTPPSHFESRQYKVGLGAVNVLVDTPDSQVVNLNPKGADVLGTRANLLANLIATTPIKTAIAARAAIPASQLIVLAPGLNSSVGTTGLEASNPAGRTANIISIRTDPQLPVISITTQGPTVATAAKLANAAVGGLRDYVSVVARSQKASAPGSQLVVRQLGEAQVAEAVRGQRRVYGLVVAVILFLAGCVGIVAGSAFIRNWRLAAASERGLAADDREDDGRTEPATAQDDHAGADSPPSTPLAAKRRRPVAFRSS